MPSPETQRALLDELCRGGALANARVLASSELGAAWASRRAIAAAAEGDIATAVGTVRIRVGLSRRFPAILPGIFLHPPDALGRVAHVERDGYVCFLAEEGVIIDRGDLVSALERCVELARDVLEKSSLPSARDDLLREFEAYWRELPRAREVDAYVTPDDRARRLAAYCNASREYVYVADDEKTARAYHSRRTLPALTKRNALYVPLEATVIDDPPVPDALLIPERLREYVHRHASPATRAALPELASKRKSEELVVLRLPRPGGGHILVGICARGVADAHPLLADGKNTSLQPVTLDRRDRAAVVPRGGAAEALANRHVLVAGCGSVGSHVATGLAYAGVGRLTLVDPDSLEAENAFRHAVGIAGDGEPKVDALRAEIERRIPFIDVTAKKGHVDWLLESNALSFSDFDGVVVAIGAPTLELILNEQIWAGQATNAVFTWLEPEGIGGHAVLARSRRAGARGCLACLYRRSEESGALQNRADFAAPGQSFVRDHAGCGGRYTAFSALDARKTADLAVELVVAALLDQVDGHPLRSWKGDAARFTAAGYRTSARYDLGMDRLREIACEYADAGCRVCGGAE